MEYRQLKKSVGTQPTLTFGCTSPNEIIGPLKPRSIQYGVQHRPVGYRYGTEMDTALFINFDAHRTDLPPWERVREIVAANQRDGKQYYVSLHDIGQCTTRVTGDLKTVTVVAETVVGGLERLSIIDRSKMGDGYQGEKL